MTAVRRGDALVAAAAHLVLLRALREAWALADAQQALLRAHHMAGGPRVLPGHGAYAPCLQPDQYQRDCGQCMRCCSVYEGGALRFDPATTLVPADLCGCPPGMRLHALNCKVAPGRDRRLA